MSWFSYSSLMFLLFSYCLRLTMHEFSITWLHQLFCIEIFVYNHHNVLSFLLLSSCFGWILSFLLFIFLSFFSHLYHMHLFLYTLLMLFYLWIMHIFWWFFLMQYIFMLPFSCFTLDLWLSILDGYQLLHWWSIVFH